MSPQYTESIQFYVPSSMHPPLILGLPRLCKHNSIIDWAKARIVSWASDCHNTCQSSVFPLNATSIDSPLAHVPVNIPDEYANMAAVFSASKAAHLHPHWPCDCAIELLPGTLPPRSRAYPLSKVETKAVEDYVAEALQQGLISKSTSPASNRFFLIEK